MYENGIKIKGYAKKRFHKHKAKKSFIERWYPEFKSYFDYLTNYKSPRNPEKKPNTKYWQKINVSNARGFAKRQTNRKVRTMFRALIHQMKYDEVPFCGCADYQKYFDYQWTVW